MSEPVLTVEGVRAVEEAVFRRVPSWSVMEMAGKGVAQAAAQELSGGGPALVLAGPGNNGGDAFVAAAGLLADGTETTVAFAGDEGRLSPDAANAIRLWKDAGGETLGELPDLGKYRLVIDGLFGIGLSKPLAGKPGRWVGQLGGSSPPVLSIDVPSGLLADSGLCPGPAVRAARTVTFFGLKPGLLTNRGADCAGRITVDPLNLADGDLPPPGKLLGHAISGLQDPGAYARDSDSHKGVHGSVLVVGGNTGMVGALALATRAAAALGAGKVHALALHAPCPACDPIAPEVMWSGVPVPGATCVAVGPGLGNDTRATEILGTVLGAHDARTPLVLDADALNIVARDPSLLPAGHGRTVIMTPHAGEAARLAGATAEAIQGDRVGSALALAERFGAHVVLKGSGSVCATPGGDWWINRSGNPGLARGGSGDILTGVVASLAAQTGDPLRSMLDGAWLHGHAADLLARQAGGPHGVDINQVARVAAGTLGKAAAAAHRP